MCNPNHELTAPGREGSVDVFFSTSTDIFPTPAVTLVDSAVFDNFGQVLVGNTFSGRSGAYGTRMTGDPAGSAPDLFVGSSTLTPSGEPPGLPRVRIISGARLPGLSGQVNLAVDSHAYDVSVDLQSLAAAPASGWLGSYGAGLRDANGDGYMDFAVSDYQPGTAHDGRILIIY